jgi:quercetin dioxygenase-like cupin family protein
MKEKNMKIKTKVSIGILAAGSIVGALAWATPIFNLALPILASGSINSDIDAHGDFATGSGEFKAFLKTEGPSSVLIQDGSFAPDGYTGWHSHPGVLALTLITGTLDWYDGDCNKKSYKAGDSWTEGSQLHYFKSTSTANIHLMVAYIIAQGEPNRIDQPAPACAAALGLD